MYIAKSVLVAIAIASNFKIPPDFFVVDHRLASYMLHDTLNQYACMLSQFLRTEFSWVLQKS